MRIVVWGNFGIGNLGNECTLRAIAIGLRSTELGAETHAVCSGPEEVISDHRILAAPFRLSNAMASDSILLRTFKRGLREPNDFVRAVRIMKDADALVVAGTGIITDSRERVFGLPYELMRWCLAAKVARAKVLFVSVGVEAIDSLLSRNFLRKALSTASYRSYRDKLSHDRLLALGFSVANDPVYPDLAFGLPELRPSSAAKFAPPMAAVGVWDYRDHEFGDGLNYSEYIDALAEFTCWLIGRGYRVRIIVGDIRQDERARRDLRAAIEARHSITSENYADDPASSVDELQEQIAEAKVVIATRYHNVVLSLLQGTPVLALSYEQKIDALLQDCGLGAFVQSVSEMNLPRLKQQVFDIEQQHSILVEKIGASTKAYRLALSEQYDRISRVLA